MKNMCGKWRRFVFKRVVPGDIRKLNAESNDSQSGGGARDFRYSPAEKFWPVLSEMSSNNQGGGCINIIFHWDNGIEKQAVIHPPTRSRNSEIRIGRVHECCPTEFVPIPGENAIFLLVQDDLGVHADFLTMKKLKEARFVPRLRTYLASAIEGTASASIAPMGFIDFDNDTQFSNTGISMSTVLFQPYFMREDILAAIRTKPFVLLAGISGTGKSRMVRQLARGCCPRYKDGSTTDDHPLYDEQKPGNFESIAVRPNWHDSTELMGYVTRITADDQPKFVLTPFVKFLAKAWQNLDVPFFLCMDEMNLAPVEQYFAEYLSVIESRDWIDAGDHLKGLQTDVMVRFDVAQIKKDASHPHDDETKNFVEQTVRELLPGYASAAEGSDLKKLGDRMIADNGLRIPPNLVVMGTVNMDETTCSFSRKVLDRAMTFELNDVSDMYDPANIAGEGPIAFNSIGPNGVRQILLTGRDACAEDAAKAKTVLDYIKSINDSLENTPFKIAYRSRNEIMVYCFERTRDGGVGLAQALDEATSMKILSRIEGDDQKLRDPSAGNEATNRTLLDVLGEKIPEALKGANGGNDPTPPCTACKDKIEFMKRRLDGGFTNFFV